MRNNSVIACGKCKREFMLIKDIPIILPKNLSDFKKIEKNFFEREFVDKENSYEFVESDWDRNTFGLLDFMKAIENYPPDAKILELGAGNGQYSLILKKKGFRNTVISDMAIEGLILAKEYLKDNSGSFFVLDAENIPFESDTFDIIFLTAALHHFPNPQRAIAQMHRCVKPNGLIAIAIEPNSWYFYVVRPIAKLLKIRKIQRSKGLFSLGDEVTRGFSLRQLIKYFEKSNITIITTQRVWYLTGFIYYLPDFIKRVFNIDIAINPKIRIAMLRIDSLIAKIPLINNFSFHNTIIGVKK